MTLHNHKNIHKKSFLTYSDLHKVIQAIRVWFQLQSLELNVRRGVIYIWVANDPLAVQVTGVIVDPIVSRWCEVTSNRFD